MDPSGVISTPIFGLRMDGRVRMTWIVTLITDSHNPSKPELKPALTTPSLCIDVASGQDSQIGISSLQDSRTPSDKMRRM